MKKYEIFLEGGYTGGHTSQAGWDTEVEWRAMASVLKLIPTIDRLDCWNNEGNTSGYYPSITFRATEEELALIKASLFNIKSIDVK
jgi:hypothetical protein